MVRRYLFPVYIFLAVSFAASGVSSAENEDFRFADRLRRDRMFVAAAEEYLRFSDRYPGSPLRPRAVFLAGESWMQGGRADEALEAFQRYLEEYPEGESACRARFYRGRIMKKLKMHQEAASEFLIINEEYPECPLAGRAIFEAGESLLYGGNPQEASLVLRKLLKTSDNQELLPVAIYTLSLALINMDRELEGYRELEKLAGKYPESPISGIALLKLGEFAVKSGNTERGGEYFKKVVDSRSEDSLREKGMFNLINLYFTTGDLPKVLSTSRRYLSEFMDAGRRREVFSLAIKGSDRLERDDEAVDLIEEFRSEFPAADSTGWTYSIKARIHAENGEDGKVSRELKKMAESNPAALFSPGILILKAELNLARKKYNEAVRHYRMALSAGIDRSERGEVLASMAGIYSGGLRDTASAVRLWEEAASSGGPELRERALFNAARGKESIGDLNGAAALYSAVVAEFQDGELAVEAERKLQLIELAPRKDDRLVDALSRLLLREGTDGRALIDGAKACLDHSALDMAASLLEEAASRTLSVADSARIEYYLGKAYHQMYRRSELLGRADRDYLKRAVSHWVYGVNNFRNTEWGEKSYRSYLELKFEEWVLSRKLEGLDRYMKFYSEPERMIWAAARKSDFLFQASTEGVDWAADSTLKVCDQLEELPAGECVKAEIARKRGYIYRNSGDAGRGAKLLREYLERYPGCGCDSRAWYDLGEILIASGEYGRAMEAYSGCLDCSDSRMELNCRLRRGDCYFYLKEYRKAELEYSSVSEINPGSTVAAVAGFRRALALEKLGREDEADSVYTALLEDESAGSSLKIRAIERMGRKNYSAGNYSEAAEYYSELVRRTGSPDSRLAYAEVLLEMGEFEKAERYFSGVLETGAADSSRVLAGRARARYMQGRLERADADLSILRARFQSYRRIPEIMLIKGKVLIDMKEFDRARGIFEKLSSDYEDYQNESLYYLALCDIESGGYARAEEKLVRHLREAPHSSLACAASLKLAFVQVRLEKLNLAARNYSLASESCSDRSLRFRAMKNLAEIYQKMEDWEKASSVWFRIIEDYPGREDIVSLLFNLGFAYGQSGKYRLARDVYSRITSITAEEDKLGRAYYWIGINLKNLGRCRDAVRQFLRVPYLRTGGMWGVTSKLEAAGCYREMGRLEEAADIYSGVIESYGADSDWGKIASGYLEKINRRQEETGTQQ